MRYIILIICISLCAIGCYTDIDGSAFNIDGTSKTYVRSVMENGENPFVSIAETVPAYSGEDLPEMLTDQDVEVSILVNSEVKYFLDYDFEQGGFTHENLVGRENQNYAINIEQVGNPEIKSNFAATTIPVEDNFETLEVVEDKSYFLPGGDPDSEGLRPIKLIYEVEVTLPEELAGDFYLIEPVGRVIKRDNTSTFHTTDFDSYTINAIHDKANNFDLTLDGKSVLGQFNQSFTERTLSMNITLDRITILDNFVHNHVYFKLHNITEDYYKYIKSGGIVGSYTGTSFVQPIIEYTNIENGRGIFGGSAMTLDSTRIN